MATGLLSVREFVPGLNNLAGNVYGGGIFVLSDGRLASVADVRQAASLFMVSRGGGYIVDGIDPAKLPPLALVSPIFVPSVGNVAGTVYGGGHFLMPDGQSLTLSQLQDSGLINSLGRGGACDLTLSASPVPPANAPVPVPFPAEAPLPPPADTTPHAFPAVPIAMTHQNIAPQIAHATPDQAATIGAAFSYTVPANAFYDVEGDSLTLSATQASGAALPSWLSFNPTTRIFSGTPLAGDAGELHLRLHASDGLAVTGDEFDIAIGTNPGTNAADTLSTAGGDDVALGLGGNDSIAAYGGNDTLYGGAGDDTLYGGSNGDNLYGGDGADVFYNASITDTRITGVQTDTIYDFVKGVDKIALDTLPFSGILQGTPVDNILGFTYNPSTDTTTINSKIGWPWSGNFGMALKGNIYLDWNDFIITNTTYGTAGADTITGSASGEGVDGGSGNDSISGLAGLDNLFGGAGNDTIEGGVGNDGIWGGDGDDLLIGGESNDGIDGMAGNDTIYGGEGTVERLYGAAGNDVFVYRFTGESPIGTTEYIIDYTDGSDRIDVRGLGLASIADFESIIFNAGADTVLTDTTAGFSIKIWNDKTAQLGNSDFFFDNVLGTGAGDNLNGTGGDDGIIGLAGNDTISAGLGGDVIRGDGGYDVMTGGGGRDEYLYAAATDSGTGVGNRDIITDFSQSDRDVINLSNFSGTFNFIGAAAFDASAATYEVRYYDDGGGNTIIEVDSDAVAGVNFQIQLTGVFTLTASDFYL